MKGLTNTQDINDFFEYSEDCLKAIRKLKKPELKEIENYMFDLNLNKEIINNKKLAIFDLDETIVHCETRDVKKADIIIKVILPSKKETEVGINIRPYSIDLIKKLKEFYVIIIYTASDKSYAEAVLNYLDPNKEIFYYRLFRNNCVPVKMNDNNIYVKDLRIFKNISIDNMVIIDNSILSFAFQVNNGIPILPFYDKKDDDEFIYLYNYLLHLLNVPSVEFENKKNFNLENFFKKRDNKGLGK